MTPFLKWAGGKRWLLKHGHPILPKINGRYIEPFLGGGAVFFKLDIQSAVLNDLNTYLVNTYLQMRDHPSELYEIVAARFSEHTKEAYYRVRSGLTNQGLTGAADFIYLNKTCFNGLFRVNQQGKFNVPKGTNDKNPHKLAEFLAWSQKLKGAQITNFDFECVIDGSSAGDFIFVDPPYTVAHNNNGFIEYNEKIFSWDDQVRLHSALTKASDRGVRFMMTNADHSAVRELYEPQYQTLSVARRSDIAGNASFRVQAKELLVYSFDANS